MRTVTLALAIALSLGACNIVKAPSQSDAQQAAASDLAKACAEYSAVRASLGLAALLPQPAAAVVGVIEAAVDPVCADQARFARDAGTVAWLFKNIAALAGAKAGLAPKDAES